MHDNPEIHKGALYLCLYTGAPDAENGLRQFRLYLARMARVRADKIVSMKMHTVTNEELLPSMKIYEYKTFAYPMMFMDFETFNNCFKVIKKIWPSDLEKQEGARIIG